MLGDSHVSVMVIISGCKVLAVILSSDIFGRMLLELKLRMVRGGD